MSLYDLQNNRRHHQKLQSTTPKRSRDYSNSLETSPKMSESDKKTSEFFSKNSHEIHLLTDYSLKKPVISQHQCERCPATSTWWFHHLPGAVDSVFYWEVISTVMMDHFSTKIHQYDLKINIEKGKKWCRWPWTKQTISTSLTRNTPHSHQKLQNRAKKSITYHSHTIYYPAFCEGCESKKCKFPVGRAHVRAWGGAI
mgnify:FL=1